MTSSKKTLITTILLTTIAAASVGCSTSRRAAVASRVAKSGKVAPLVRAAKEAVAERAAALPKVFQSARLNQLHSVKSLEGFAADNVIDVVTVLPKDEATFKRIYGYSPSEAQLSSVIPRVSSISSITGESEGVAGAVGGKEEFVAYLDKSPANNIAVIGHNQKGNFYFPDGESLHLREMARLIDERGKRGIFLTCEANKYLPEGCPASTIKHKPDYALKVLNNLSIKLRVEAARNGLEADDLVSARMGSQTLGARSVLSKPTGIQSANIYELIQGTINSAERSEARKRTTKRVATAGAGVGGIYYFNKLTAKK